MSLGAVANLVRFGKGQSSPEDTRELFDNVFAGEVLTAYTSTVIMSGLTWTKTISEGVGDWFPKTGRTRAYNHTPGNRMEGGGVPTGKVTVNVDGLTVAHTEIYDLDKAMSHWDQASVHSKEIGEALARVDDSNRMRAVISAARSADDGPFLGGMQLTDAGYVETDGGAMIEAFREAATRQEERDIPNGTPRYGIVSPRAFKAMRYAQDSNGRYILIDADLTSKGDNKTDGPEPAFLDIDGIKVMKSNIFGQKVKYDSRATGTSRPNWASIDPDGLDERNPANIYAKYALDFSKTVGFVFTPMTIGTVVLLGVRLESERDVRAKTDFVVADMAVGHDTLRADLAVEIRSAAPAALA